MFVIFARPQEYGRPGNRYIATDGSKTYRKSKAAKFYTHADADEFAKAMNVKLTKLTYIGQEDFIDFEIQHDS